MVCNLTDTEVAQIFERLGTLVEDVFTEAGKALELDTSISELNLQSILSGDFWDETLTSEQEDLARRLENNTALNPADLNTAGFKFNNILTTLFGGPSVVSDVDTNLENTFGAKLTQAFDNPFASCDNSVSAIGTIQGIVNIQRRKLNSVFEGLRGTFGTLVGQDETVGPAIFVIALKNYVVRITAQNLILKEIQRVVGRINSDIADLSDDDYSIDHQTVLTESVRQLSAADNILRAQLDNVLRRFPLNMKAYDDAQNHIEVVRDALCGIDLQDLFGGYLSLKVLEISANLVYLDELVLRLKETDEIAQRILVNLGSFDTAYENITFFDDLFVPVIEFLRCRLGVTIGDITATINENKLANYIVKEKQWCLELELLISLMNASKIFDIDKEGTVFDVDNLSDPLNALFSEVTSSDAVVSIDSIVGAIDAYTKNVRYKLSFNVPVTQIQARGNLVDRLIEQRITENESFALLINSRTLSIEGNILSGITIATAFITSIEDIEALGKVGQELQEGNLSGFLDGTLLEDTQVGVFEKILGEIEESLERVGCSLLDIGDKSLGAYDIFESTTRADALFSESLSGFPETHLREVLTFELPKYNQE